MSIKIEELKVGSFYRGKGKKGQKCSNARSPFYGRYLDRKITALRYSYELDNIEVDFEVKSTKGRTQTKTATIAKFIKWTQGEVDEDEGVTKLDLSDPKDEKRFNRSALQLGLSEDRKVWRQPR